MCRTCASIGSSGRAECTACSAPCTAFVTTSVCQKPLTRVTSGRCSNTAKSGIAASSEPWGARAAAASANEYASSREPCHFSHQ